VCYFCIRKSLICFKESILLINSGIIVITINPKLLEHTGECPFCRATVESNAFMESENFLAIYNIAPILRGHSLVIPRKHVESLFDLSEIELTEFTQFSKKVTELLLEAFKGDGFDWSIQEGLSAGQSIPHLHLHIVIRKPKDIGDESEWYMIIRENEKNVLDSASRAHLSDEEYRFYTDFLKNELQLKKSKSLDKE
jgi:bis(5'-adenosyl)-triphosphatase